MRVSPERIWQSPPGVRLGSSNAVVTRGLPRHAVTYLFRTTGQVLGVSLSGTILQAVLQKKLQERITGAGAAEVSSATALIPLQLNAVVV